MKRKSFNIEEQQLRRVSSVAKELGVSVNEFIRMALVEKIDRRRDKDGVLQLIEEVSAALVEIRKATKGSEALVAEELRLAVAAIERQQAEFIAKQQELLTTFLLTLGAQLRGQGTPSAGAPPKPIDPWGLDPIGPTHPHK